MPAAPRLLVAIVLALAPAALDGCARVPTALARPSQKGKTPIYKAPSVSGVATPVGGAAGGGFLTSLGAIEPATAPGGERMAFHVPGRGLFVAYPDGRDARPVASSTADDHDPAWTEAGDMLHAVRHEGAGAAFVRIPPQGPVERLYASKALLKRPAFIPGAGGWLLVEESGRTGKLLRLARGGATPQVLAEAPLLDAPTVSPDGRVAIAERRAAAGGTELVRVDLAGGGLTPLPVTGANPRRPAFAPGGRQLAWVADDGVYLGDATGAAGRLVSRTAGVEALAWHPKQPRLVAGAREGSRTDLQGIDL